MTPQSPDQSKLLGEARAVLEAAWDEERGHTYPNPSTYPHQWLWDSSFVAIAWAHAGRPDRAERELNGVFSAQFPDGFVPHVRYATPDHGRGPLDHCSSFTQPPIYAHAAYVLARWQPLPDGFTGRIAASLDWLWRRRRTDQGLIRLVHPWESGADDSPRWDDWVASYLGVADPATLRWNRADWSLCDRHLVDSTDFDAEGVADHSTVFECAPAAYNALYAHAAAELAALTGDALWDGRSRELADLMDELLWDERQSLWNDLPVVGGGACSRIPTLDGVLGALCTHDESKAQRALDQLGDPRRFAAPYGPAYVARNHPAYDRDGYWRGTAWMQMNYLAALAARRWDRHDLVRRIADCSRASAERSGFAEHWNPETGQGHGATPLTWSSLVVTF